MEKLKVKVILGSTRPQRFSDKPGRWIADLARKREDMDVELLDLRDYDMPLFNEPVSAGSKKEPFKNEVVAKWTAKIAEADAFIFVTPEYNRGTSGVLKNAIDWVYPEWNKKAVGFVSYGVIGGARAVETLRISAVELQMVSVRHAVYIPSHWTLQDEKGDLKPGALDSYARHAEGMFEQIAWWGRVLKDARAKE